MSKIYGFDEYKNKHEIYEKGNFAILKSEYFFTTNTEATGIYEGVMHHLNFPNESWNVDNTRILEARITLYNKMQDGTFLRNISKLIGDSQIEYKNGNFSSMWEMAQVSISPDHYTELGQEADIYYYHNACGVIGDKEVFEVLLLKVDMEEN